MHIQTSRLISGVAPTMGMAVSVAANPALSDRTRSDTITISQAAKDLLAQSQASASLSTRGMELIQRRNPFDIAPNIGNQQAQVRTVMDNLTAQHNSRQISSAQYQQDMAFYSRMSNAIG